MKNWLFLLRGFFPSWRFFDDLGPELRLEARYGGTESQLGDWVNCLPPIPRSAKNLFLNARGNYLHACHNHLNHMNADILASDVTDPEALIAKPTYAITKNMARYQLQELGLARPPFVFQFRLSAVYENKIADQILVSPVYEG